MKEIPTTERDYTVYFQIFGKRMKTKVLAKSEQEAKDKVIAKLIFDKVEINKGDYFNQAMDIMDDIRDVLGGNKKK